MRFWFSLAGPKCEKFKKVKSLKTFIRNIILFSIVGLSESSRNVKMERTLFLCTIVLAEAQLFLFWGGGGGGGRGMMRTLSMAMPDLAPVSLVRFKGH